ncbi:MAG: MarR family transcriptional regulator [Propionibacteriaceae bacterium]|nr:MarR family transcriptional regulator [Propionibacteriaceae bacterium]
MTPEQAVLDAVNRGAITLPQIAEATGLSAQEVAVCVARLVFTHQLAGASSLGNCLSGCADCSLVCDSRRRT